MKDPHRKYKKVKNGRKISANTLFYIENVILFILTMYRLVSNIPLWYDILYLFKGVKYDFWQTH